MNRDAVDSGRKPGLTTEEHKELVELRRRLRVLEMENKTLKRASAYFARENVLPKWGFRLVQELAADGEPVAVACRFLGVSTSGYHERRERMPSPRSVADAELTITIRRIHSDSREIYGAPRVLAELRPGLGVQVGRKRVARLMRLDGLVGVSHRRKRRGWKPDTATHEDLVKRQFRADAPYRLWFCDITQHRARDGWVYCAAVIDAYSRRIVGWSISDRITAEIVVDALEMARWRRRVRLRGSGVRVPSGPP